MAKEENWIQREFVKALIQALVILIVGGIGSWLLKILTPSTWQAVKEVALLRIPVPLILLVLTLLLSVLAILFMNRSIGAIRAELVSKQREGVPKPRHRRNDVQVAVLKYLAVQQNAVRDDTIAAHIAGSDEGQAKHWTQPQAEAALAVLEGEQLVRWILRDYRKCFQLTQRGFDAVELAQSA